MAARAFVTLALMMLIGLGCISIARRLGDDRPVVARRRLAVSGVFSLLVLLLLVLLVLRR